MDYLFRRLPLIYIYECIYILPSLLYVYSYIKENYYVHGPAIDKFLIIYICVWCSTFPNIPLEQVRPKMIDTVTLASYQGPRTDRINFAH